MHSQAATEADVTEGTGGVWERLHYGWSDPNRVVVTDTDSNTWAVSPVTSTPSHTVKAIEDRNYAPHAA